MWPFSEQKNPADAAMPYFKQIEEMQRGNYNPYAPPGMQNQGGLGQQYYGMGSDPASHYNDLMSGYTESPAYKYKYDNAMKAAGQQAAAGGMTGTAGDQLGQGALAGALQSQDMQQWLENLMNIQGQGMQGQERQMSDLYGNLGTQGTLGFQGQQQKNANQNALLSGAMQGIGTLGGAFLGGPMGAAAGGAFGKWLSGGQGDTGGFASQNNQGYGYNNPNNPAFGRY